MKNNKQLVPIVQRNKKSYVIITLAVIVFGLYFRLYPATINQARQIRHISRLTAYIALKKSLANKIDQHFPHLNADEKSKLLNKKFSEFISKDTQKLDLLISNFIKQSSQELHTHYLLGSDSYYYYYLTKKLAHEGTFSQTVSHGKHFDSLMMAPLGYWRNFELPPLLGLWLYQFLHTCNKNISLMNAAAIIPLITFMLAVAVFIAICSLLKINRFAIFISSIFFCLSPIFIQRSSLGWYDSDPYNILFQLSSLFILFRVFNSEFKLRWVVVLSVLSSLYSLFWQGWVVLPTFICLTFLFLLVYKVASKKEWIPIAKLCLVYSIGVISCAIIFLTPKGFVNSAQEVFGIFSGFLFLEASKWPDVFLTVGELKIPSINKIIHVLGGFVFAALSLIGFLVLLPKRNKNVPREHSLTLLLFYLLCFVMAKNAERFILFLLVPASICVALGIDALRLFFLETISRFIKIRPSAYRFVVYSFLSLLLISPLIYAHAISLQQMPIFNDVWDSALNQIRVGTPPNSIINTWWPPGHFIKAIAGRRVTFDGATINTPQAYWMARFFLSDSEEEALAIIRMLNASGNKATEFLVEKGIPLEKAVQVIHNMLLLDKKQAEMKLASFLSTQDTHHLLSLTHSPSDPSYCFVYNDLIENALGLYFLKDWDFEKAYEVQKKRSARLKQGNVFWRGTKDNISVMWSIAGGPTYIGEESHLVSRTEDTLYFKNGVTLNIQSMEASLDNLEGKISGIPRSILFIDNGNFFEKNLTEASVNLSVLLIKHPPETYSCLVAPGSILKSILFRLYYLDGIGLEHFEKVIQEEDPRLNTRILVYRIKW
ncbi:STT3 domain-containing protein [Candidatus Omnitrophota bacterium]